MLDLARGVALIAMCVYHFVFDLELFGVVDPGYSAQAGWKYFARAIATSFLMLAGASLFLAHHSTIAWPRWGLRIAKICGAAALITLATWLATPGQYIFFGILHQIAFASVAGLLMVRWNGWLLLILAGAIFGIGQTAALSFLDHPIWYWTGLQAVTPISSDYVPVFPWLAPVILGIGLTRLCMDRSCLDALATIDPQNRAVDLLKFFGRNSLVFYLLHQPVIIACLLAWLWFAGRVVF